MKYDVKNEHGQLTFGSFRELYVLYQREFVSDDDLVRKHGTDRWVPAGAMPELKGSRSLVADKSTPVWAALLLGFLIFGCLVALRLHSGAFLPFLFVVFVFVAVAAYFKFRFGGAAQVPWSTTIWTLLDPFAHARRARGLPAKQLLARAKRSEAVSGPPEPGTDDGESKGQG